MTSKISIFRLFFYLLNGGGLDRRRQPSVYKDVAGFVHSFTLLPAEIMASLALQAFQLVAHHK